MEDHLADAAAADLLVKIGWHLAGAFLALVVGVISTLLWGRGGRKRLVESNKRLNERVAALEVKNRAPAITQTIYFNGAASADEREHNLRSAIDTETVQGLRETMSSLLQTPLEGGHTYAKLPDGTNIVSRADGSFSLALPVRLSGIATIKVGGSATLNAASAREAPA